MEGVEEGLKVGHHLIQTVTFAGNQEMMASSVRGLQTPEGLLTLAIERRVEGKLPRERKRAMILGYLYIFTFSF